MPSTAVSASAKEGGASGIWVPARAAVSTDPSSPPSSDGDRRLRLLAEGDRSAVGVDGPSHFLLPDGRGVRKPNGPTLLKRRLLAAAGWRVISVPFYEWNGFATANGQQTYLERAVAPLLG